MSHLVWSLQFLESLREVFRGTFQGLLGEFRVALVVIGKSQRRIDDVSCWPTMIVRSFQKLFGSGLVFAVSKFSQAGAVLANAQRGIFGRWESSKIVSLSTITRLARPIVTRWRSKFALPQPDVG